MKLYLFSLGAGVMVGIFYSLIAVRSPAPPVVALVGLLGILAGEQVIPVSRQILAGIPFAVAWRQSGCTQHLFGTLPGRDVAQAAANPPVANSETDS